MMEKKICMYDSMGSHGMEYLEGLLHFINDEHMSKKGVPLYDISEWELVGHISQLRITVSKTPLALLPVTVCMIYQLLFAIVI
jgi:hypothetical protein